jgi:tetratricopeptide (TPR) repeat protein
MESKKANYQEELLRYTNLIENNPSKAVYYLERGLIREKFNDLQGQIEDYLKVIEYDGERGMFSVHAYYNLGLVFKDLKEFEKSLEYHQKALDADSNYIDAYSGLGGTYLSWKKFEKAKFYFDKYLAIIQDPRIYCNRGITRRELGDLKGAKEDFDKAIEINPNDEQADIFYYNRGVWYLRYDKENVHEAKNDFSKALDRNPLFGKVYFEKGMAHLTVQNYVNAEYCFLKYIEIVADDGMGYNNLSHVYNVLGKYHLALQTINKAIEIDNTEALFYYNRAHSYRFLTLYDMAIEDYNKASMLGYGDASLYNCRALCYSLIKIYSCALEDYNNAISLEPNNPNHYCGRGIVYYNLGNNEKGCKDFKYAKSIGSTTADSLILKYCSKNNFFNFFSKYK